jgi:hypothetical protein
VKILAEWITDSTKDCEDVNRYVHEEWGGPEHLAKEGDV